jgi:threonine dehydrogenase-like Zn-dependent dehydrogenase
MPVTTPAWLKRQPSSPAGAPPPPEAIEAFKAYVDAESFPDALKAHGELLKHLNLSPDRFHEFYPKFKSAIKEHLPFRYKEIFKIFSEKAKQKPYQGVPCENQKVLVVGGGPMGFRTAIETQLLGARTLVVEKREDFTRHNILKLWKFLIPDYKSLGVKKFVGRFCSGAVNHIGIQSLQLFLAKVCLFLGVEIVAPVGLVHLVEPAGDLGWTAKFSPEGTAADNYEFDFVVIASGKKVAIDGFNRRSLDAAMSIAVTANFKNNNTPEEKAVAEISGISKQYHMDFFKGMKTTHNIDLENIVYYRGNTHYFVMTALRSSLIERGVILGRHSPNS